MSTTKIRFKKWLREPLVHFLLLGAFLFLLFDIVSKDNRTGDRNEIVITTGTLRSLQENFQRVWQRPPKTEEMEGLVQDYIKEEIFYREAVAMGLDRDDTIVRRRLRQKMEFLSDSFAGSREPTDQELQEYLRKHPEKFRKESLYTFSHVFLNPEKREKTIERDAENLLAELNQSEDSGDPGEHGDSFMLGYYFSNSPEGHIGRTFGEEFAKGLAGQETGKWAGPVKSAYGLHLVFISNKVEGGLPALAEIREQVLREWTNENQQLASRKFYEELRSRYTITIEEPSKKGP